MRFRFWWRGRNPVEQERAKVGVFVCPAYWPRSFLLCRLKRVRCQDGTEAWVPDGLFSRTETIPIPEGPDWPKLAEEFGWRPGAYPSEAERIAASAEFLNDCVTSGKVIADPGYFNS